MKKILQVAWHEFLATVATKGFLLGLVIMPLITIIAIVGMRALINEKPPQIRGRGGHHRLHRGSGGRSGRLPSSRGHCSALCRGVGGDWPAEISPEAKKLI